ncbi:acyl-CoA thioesterase [Solwaraspora sp. WMMB335]|uniref:acyl-CoA thioesterase n=1 Tax=Solwaraspora sp. WMMB335 TaxID=3404118 RepID=UPI003B94850C
MYFGESRLRLQARPNDLDILGHVNNAVALEYLEAGRWDWLDRTGLVQRERFVAVVARCEADYLAEIPRGPIEVRTVLESPSEDEFDPENLTYRACFRQRVHLPGAHRPAVDARITVAFLDARRRCLVTLQDFLAASGPHRDERLVMP